MAHRGAETQRRRPWSGQMVAQLLLTAGSNPPPWPFAVDNKEIDK